jgi:hypothetical protein
MINKILPFLNKLLPPALAIKGIGSIDPRLQKFLTGAAAAGFGTDQAIDFLRSKFDSGSGQQGTERPDEAAGRKQVEQSNVAPNALQSAASLAGGVAGGLGALGLGSAQQAQQPQPQIAQQPSPQPQSAPQPQNENPQGQHQARSYNPGAGFISQHPELGAYLDELMKKGNSPKQAAEMARASRKFGALVSQIENEIGQDFPSLIDQLFNPSKPGSSPKKSTRGQDLVSSFNRLSELLKARKGG